MSFDHLLNIDLKQATNAAMLDDLSGVAKQARESISDDLDEKALSHAIYDLRQKSLAVVLTLAENILDGDLDGDETPSDRMEVLVSAYVDDDDDIVLSALYANMQDVMVSLGVSEGLAEQVLYDDDPLTQDEAIESMAEIINSNVPDDEDFEEWQAEFIYREPAEFGDDDEAEQLDALKKSETSRHYAKNKHKAGQAWVKNKNGKHITYKGVKAVRNGKITIVGKRVGGDYKLSSKQKAALSRMGKKAHTESANRSRLRSLMLGMKKGIYKKQHRNAVKSIMKSSASKGGMV